MGKGKSGAKRILTEPPPRKEDTVENKVSSAIEDIIGKAEHFNSIEYDLRNVNETNYLRTDKNYTQNCQRCAPAFELRRRGYDVEALDFDKTYPDFRQIFDWKSRDFDSYIMSNSRYVFGGNGANPNKMPSSAPKAANLIADTMNKWGNGSRAMMEVKWKGASAHIINLENVNGEIYMLDSQSGNSSHGIKAIEHYLRDTVISATTVTRVDHLKIKENLYDLKRIAKKRETEELLPRKKKA